MSLFQYFRISREFIQDLYLKVRSGQSAVVLGPRYVGKRYVIRTLGELLERAKVAPRIELRFLADSPITEMARAREEIIKAVTRSGFRPEERETQDLLDPLEQLADHLNRPVALLAANIDGMANHLTRGFLRGVRTLVEQSKVVAVMSGEEDFNDLVHGKNREFDCANQLVLQGHDEETFYDFVRQYLSYTRLRLEPEDEVLRVIWTLTGGNIYTMRVVLWAIVQLRSKDNVASARPVGVEDVPKSLKLTGIPGAYGAHIFRHATQVIDREPNAWEDLEGLMGGRVIQTDRATAPITLELSGVAVRTELDGVEQLAFASPLIREFVKHHYGHKRMGDLYGSVRRWDKAFERYQLLGPEEKMRPSGPDDRGAVEMMVAALGSSLYAKATRVSPRLDANDTVVNASEVIEELEKLFALGCHYVLGFREVTFWYRNSAQHSHWWEYKESKTFGHRELEVPDDHTPALKVIKEIQSRLPTEPNLRIGVHPLRAGGNQHGLLAILPSLVRDEQTAVVVSDFETETVISRERRELAERLFTHFTSSYKHVASIDGLQKRFLMRSELGRIINNIFDMLGSPRLSVRNLLEIVARDLRELGYRRVVISLVDAEGRAIEGIHDDSNDVAKIHRRINWPLDDPAADVQPYVVNSGKPYVILDSFTDPYADRATMSSGGIKTAAVVPVINPRNKAIGTLLIERDNRLPPSTYEVNALEEFGRQLAIAVEQCERVNLLEECLNKIPEPLMIVDRTENLRYRNRPAAALLGGPSGWLDPDQTFPLQPDEAADILTTMRNSLNSGHRITELITGIGRARDYEAEVIADTIADWRGADRIAGGLLRFHDRTYLHKHFAAVRQVAEARETQDVIKRMMEAMEMLGHTWGRLYLARETDDGGPVLVSEYSYGHPAAEDEHLFNQRRIKLASHGGQGHKEWRCIDLKTPIIFCWLEGLAENDPRLMSHGLRAVNWPDPPHPPQVRKRPGDFWLDFPLYSDRPLGKICLQCNEDLHQEHFEFLKHLSVTFSTLLDAALLRERAKEESEKTIKIAVAQKTMQTMAHNIGTRHGSIPGLLTLYRKMEKKLPELTPINDKFAHVSEHILATIKRAKELLSPVNVQRAPVNLLEQIPQCIESALPEGASCRVTCEGVGDTLIVPLDAHLFDTALAEMVQNSRIAMPRESDLQVTVTVRRLQEDGREWVELLYEDNGTGVAPEIEPRIFEDFFSHRPNRESAGTGLGMSFVLRVIKGHGGQINYVARPAPGARFLIRLPGAPAPAAQEEVNV